MTESMHIPPMDEHNTRLIANVHPAHWHNPTPAPMYNLVVLGAGTAGLVCAAGAAGLAARVALVEKRFMGGDCLNFGCVPSKALIRSAQWAVQAGHADFAAVMERLRRLRADISAHDSAKRFTDLGVDVFLGEGRFAGPDRLHVAGETLRFKKAVIATGSSPIEPAIDGLAQAGFLTNETIFSLTDRPDRLVVIGGGPIGCELAQAFRRLGSAVTIIQRRSRFLPKEESDAAAILADVFRREGIDVMLNAHVTKVTASDGRKTVSVNADGNDKAIDADAILVAAGRQANVNGMAFKKAGVECHAKGVVVGDTLRTTNPRIYAAGDVCLTHKFTHTADAAARIVLQNALFPSFKKKVSALIVPWCTYTDPEIAHVGLNHEQAAAQGLAVDTFTRSLADVDRAVVDGETDGFVKIHVRKGSDTIIGATIVARHAGEMISEITTAMTARAGLKTLGAVIHPYPTQAEAIKHLADAYTRTRLTPRTKRLFKRWFAWRRR